MVALTSMPPLLCAKRIGITAAFIFRKNRIFLEYPRSECAGARWPAHELHPSRISAPLNRQSCFYGLRDVVCIARAMKPARRQHRRYGASGRSLILCGFARFIGMSVMASIYEILHLERYHAFRHGERYSARRRIGRIDATACCVISNEIICAIAPAPARAGGRGGSVAASL